MLIILLRKVEKRRRTGRGHRCEYRKGHCKSRLSLLQTCRSRVSFASWNFFPLINFTNFSLLFSKSLTWKPIKSRAEARMEASRRFWLTRQGNGRSRLEGLHEPRWRPELKGIPKNLFVCSCVCANFSFSFDLYVVLWRKKRVCIVYTCISQS